jgi:hypothetical protein
MELKTCSPSEVSTERKPRWFYNDDAKTVQQGICMTSADQGAENLRPLRRAGFDFIDLSDSFRHRTGRLEWFSARGVGASCAWNKQYEGCSKEYITLHGSSPRKSDHVIGQRTTRINDSRIV